VSDPSLYKARVMRENALGGHRTRQIKKYSVIGIVTFIAIAVLVWLRITSP
jgi:hypothetical protein